MLPTDFSLSILKAQTSLSIKKFTEQVDFKNGADWYWYKG